jgi:hypothetical protein
MQSTLAIVRRETGAKWPLIQFVYMTKKYAFSLIAYQLEIIQNSIHHKGRLQVILRRPTSTLHKRFCKILGRKIRVRHVTIKQNNISLFRKGYSCDKTKMVEERSASMMSFGLLLIRFHGRIKPCSVC